MGVEEHGAGRQLASFRFWPKCSRLALTLTIVFGALSAAAGLDHAWAACGALGALTLLLGLRTVQQSGTATAAVLRALKRLRSVTGTG